MPPAWIATRVVGGNFGVADKPDRMRAHLLHLARTLQLRPLMALTSGTRLGPYETQIPPGAYWRSVPRTRY